MKLKLLFVCIFLALVTSNTLAQNENLSVDEIIKKYATALGGQERLQQVHSQRLTGVYTFRGWDHSITIIRMKPDRCRIEIINDGKKIITVCNGNLFWEIDEARSQEARDIRDASVKNFVEMLAVFEDAIIDYSAKGHLVALAGQEKVDNDSAYKLEVTRANGTTEHWFIDTTSFLLLKRVSTFMDENEQAEQAIFYMDYKSVEGIMLPHYFERSEFHYVRGYEIKSVEFNPDIDKADFELMK